jgi:endonuclease/exonuclease/phosphatase family metal-dependent hydrolase
MKRLLREARTLLQILIVAMCLNVAAQARSPQRLTEIVPQLGRIELARRHRVATNPEQLTPAALNTLVPEIDAIELSNEHRTPTTASRLRVLAWNIERGGNWRDAAALIESHPALEKPDILLLSEMDLGVARTRNEHTTAELAKRLGMNYAYVVEFLELSAYRTAEVPTADPSEAGYHGNAILSRFPLQQVRALRFPGIEAWYGSGEHRLGGRNAIFAEINVNGKTITLAATHLESGALDNAVRAQQVRWILEELDAHASGQRVIFGGDLNSPALFPAIRQIEKAGFNLSDANLLSEPTTQRKVNGRIERKGLHIDYLAIRGLAVLKSATSPTVVDAAWPDATGTLISDHAVIACDVMVEAKNDDP